MKAVVLGSGAWGTALAIVLCENGHDVTLWSHRGGKAEQLAQSRINPQLKGIALPETMSFSGDIACVQGAELVVCATASFAVRETAKAMAPYLSADTIAVSVTKGIERGSHLWMTQVIASEVDCQVVALSGPSHAEEVSRKLPTGCVAACENQAVAEQVQDWFMNPYFRIYTSDDPVGVELGGALKNVVALSCGICDGMGFGDNTKALLMTRAITEISRLVISMGGQQATLAGLAGVGDLIVTCTSAHSRNRQAGILIGQGKTAQEAMDAVGAVVEGYYAAQSVMDLSAEFGVEMPISQCAYQVLFETRDVHDVVGELMTRSKKGE